MKDSSFEKTSAGQKSAPRPTTGYNRPITEHDPTAQPAGANHYLGVKLRHTRMTKGLRLRDLAEKAECSESMLSKIENDRAVPSLDPVTAQTWHVVAVAG